MCKGNKKLIRFIMGSVKIKIKQRRKIMPSGNLVDQVKITAPKSIEKAKKT